MKFEQIVRFVRICITTTIVFLVLIAFIKTHSFLSFQQEERLKELKRKKKETDSKKNKHLSDSEDSPELQHSSRRQRVGGDNDDEQSVPSQYSISSHRMKPLTRSLSDERLDRTGSEFSPMKHNLHTPLPPLRRSMPSSSHDLSPRPSGKSVDRSRSPSPLRSDEEDEIYRRNWLKEKKSGTPRPDSLGGQGEEDKENDIFGTPLVKRGGLRPIGHVGHLEPLDQLSGWWFYFVLLYIWTTVHCI